MKNISKLVIVVSIAVIILFFSVRLDTFFVLLMMIFGLLFLISLVAPQLFNSIFGDKVTKNGIRVIFGIMVGICFVAFGVSSDHIAEGERKKQQETIRIKSEKTLSEINTLVEDEKIEQAISKIKEAGTSGVNMSKINILEGKINKLESKKFLDKALIKLSDEEVELLRKQSLQKEFIKHKKLNSLFIAKLLQNIEQRPVLIAKIEEEKLKKEEEEKKKEEEEKKLARTQKIESQFSIWDGAHKNLSRMIKDSMNDPKSYEHVETRYFDMDDHLVVITTFRGSNAFGAIVKNTVKANVSLDGEVLEIIEEL